MSDTEKLRAATEASIHAAANQIVAGFKRERIPTEIALGIVGCVAAELIKKFPVADQADWTKHFRDCFEP